ncbi:hypothetical protein [Streptomyces niveus]|uniref:hypothetical protein n=1 Tax=Streptomyces niveus TaxID=193462 RepID=UPI00386A1E6C
MAADYAEGSLSLRAEMMLQRRAHGWTYREIGADFDLSGDRVGQILKQVREALGVETDTEAVAQVVSQGLMDVGGYVEHALGKRTDK